jgi:hypothetical protein
MGRDALLELSREVDMQVSNQLVKRSQQLQSGLTVNTANRRSDAEAIAIRAAQNAVLYSCSSRTGLDRSSAKSKPRQPTRRHPKIPPKSSTPRPFPARRENRGRGSFSVLTILSGQPRRAHALVWRPPFGGRWMFRLRFFINRMDGEAQGPGIVTHWKPMARWTIKTGQAFTRVKCTAPAMTRFCPWLRREASLRSVINPTRPSRNAPRVPECAAFLRAIFR